MDQLTSVTIPVILGLTILSLVLAVFNFVIVKRIITVIQTKEDQIYARLLILTKQLEEITGIDYHVDVNIDPDQILRDMEGFLQEQDKSQ